MPVSKRTANIKSPAPHYVLLCSDFPFLRIHLQHSHGIRRSAVNPPVALTVFCVITALSRTFICSTLTWCLRRKLQHRCSPAGACLSGVGSCTHWTEGMRQQPLASTLNPSCKRWHALLAYPLKPCFEAPGGLCLHRAGVLSGPCSFSLPLLALSDTCLLETAASCHCSSIDSRCGCCASKPSVWVEWFAFASLVLTMVIIRCRWFEPPMGVGVFPTLGFRQVQSR
jgi:hypothetical protein